MANILTQQEIDELMQNISMGKDTETEKEEVEDHRIRKYDFRLANKFTKEQIKSLNTIFDNYSRLLTNYFSSTLRSTCEVEIVSVEEQKFFEYTNSQPSVSLYGIIGMKPLIGSSLLDIAPQLAYAMINRVLGGAATYDNNVPSFTDIELVIMERIIRQMLAMLDEAWHKIVPIDSTLERIETNPQFAQIVSVNETIAIITMNVKINAVEGFMHFCIPHMSIKPIEKQLTVRSLFSNKVEDNVPSSVAIAGIKDSLKFTNLNLIAKLDSTFTSVRDCLNLQIGDVLMIDHPLDKPVNVYIEHIPKFKGKLGKKDGKYAVEIKEIYYREEENDEWDIITRGN